MTHVRLTSRFRECAPSAWAAIQAVALRFEAALPVRSHAQPLGFKQADYLLYDGARRDSAGWHEHSGESVLFVVAALSQPEEYEGGLFRVRDDDAQGEGRALKLRRGDLVVCVSQTEHKVDAITAGHRRSLNIDFWDLQNDRRSDHDKI